jgi:predicted AlkP superfamily pyrophosphatase or phosphodiesterase
VTLANHTTLNTGAHPGHHGVLHNAWYDRAAGRQVVTESPATWQESMRWLFDGVETVHEAVHRRWPDAVTVAVNEPDERGADYSTMELMRRGEVNRLWEGAAQVTPHANAHWVEKSTDYKWGTIVDDSAVRQVAAIWAGEHLGVAYRPPAFCWVSFSLTDSAFHEGGPYSEIARAALVDTDARLGEVVAAVERRGVADRTAFLLVADHGMEETAPERGGDWGDALRAAGIEHRDEASGFLYLGVAPDPT